MTLALGIDVGTSGVRTAVLEGDTVLSMARADHPDQTGDDIDANDWWSAVSMCLQRQVAALRALDRDPGEIAGVAVDGTSGSMVLTDEDLTPVGPALLYNSKGFDAEAVKIAQYADDRHITRGSNSALARAMRLVSQARTRPTHLLHQADFIAAKLLGRGAVSDYNNTLKTGFDPETERWPDWVGNVIAPDLLPRVVAPGTAIGRISNEISEGFGLSPSVMVHAGTTDSIAAFLAAAPLELGMAVTSLGSTLAIKLLSANKMDDPSIGLYSHRLGDFWLVGGASNTGGAVLKKYFSDEDLTRLSEEIDPGNPTGLNFYPLKVPGERFPINDPKLAPKLDPRPDSDAKFLQAMFEGMAAIEARCFEEIKAKGGTAPTQIFTAGGGAQNRKWTAVRQYYLGQNPLTPKHSEAAVGVAKLVNCEHVDPTLQDGKKRNRGVLMNTERRRH